MAFWDKFTKGDKKQPAHSKAEAMEAALAAKFPDHAKTQGFLVEYQPARIAGEGMYQIRTTKTFSRKNWVDMGLKESTATEVGDFTRSVANGLVQFDMREAPLEKALGIAKDGRAASA